MTKISLDNLHMALHSNVLKFEYIRSPQGGGAYAEKSDLWPSSVRDFYSPWPVERRTVAQLISQSKEGLLYIDNVFISVESQNSFVSSFYHLTH